MSSEADDGSYALMSRYNRANVRTVFFESNLLH